jgi:tripartite-type tricarboxylate transporter receptor subunit TctC
MAPKGTPVSIVNRLNMEVARITASAEVRKAWAAQGATAMTMGVAEFSRYLEADIVKWAAIVKISGAKVD